MTRSITIFVLAAMISSGVASAVDWVANTTPNLPKLGVLTKPAVDEFSNSPRTPHTGASNPLFDILLIYQQQVRSLFVTQPARKKRTITEIRDSKQTGERMVYTS